MAGCNCNSWFFLYSLSLYKFFEEKAFLLEVYDSSKREWANNGSCDVSAIRQLFIETFCLLELKDTENHKRWSFGGLN